MIMQTLHHLSIIFLSTWILKKGCHYLSGDMEEGGEKKLVIIGDTGKGAWK